MESDAAMHPAGLRGTRLPPERRERDVGTSLLRLLAGRARVLAGRYVQPSIPVAVDLAGSAEGRDGRCCQPEVGSDVTRRLSCPVGDAVVGGGEGEDVEVG